MGVLQKKIPNSKIVCQTGRTGIASLKELRNLSIATVPHAVVGLVMDEAHGV